MEIHDAIRDLRTKRGLSQDELAAAVGYTDRSSIAKIEAGKVDLTVSKIKAFAEFFHVTPASLLCLDEESESEPGGLKQRLNTAFDQLNEDGQERTVEYAELLTLDGKYKKRHQHENMA